jgi:phage FluMu protein Com
MGTEQLVTGERYLGAKCPECGEMAAHSKADDDKTSGAHVELSCRNGHRFSARTEELLHFEWGAQ